MSVGPLPPPPLVERLSGLVVPAHLRALPERRSAGVSEDATGAVDADGRRRLVLTDSERKALVKAVKVLEAHGFTMIVRCQDGGPTSRADRVAHGQPEPCGQVLQAEGQDTPDPGPGCQCTRIHFIGA